MRICKEIDDDIDNVILIRCMIPKQQSRVSLILHIRNETFLENNFTLECDDNWYQIKCCHINKRKSYLIWTVSMNQ